MKKFILGLLIAFLTCGMANAQFKRENGKTTFIMDGEKITLTHPKVDDRYIYNQVIKDEQFKKLKKDKGIFRPFEWILTRNIENAVPFKTLLIKNSRNEFFFQSLSYIDAEGNLFTYHLTEAAVDKILNTKENCLKITNNNSEKYKQCQLEEIKKHNNNIAEINDIIKEVIKELDKFDIKINSIKNKEEVEEMIETIFEFENRVDTIMDLTYNGLYNIETTYLLNNLWDKIKIVLSKAINKAYEYNFYGMNEEVRNSYLSLYRTKQEQNNLYGSYILRETYKELNIDDYYKNLKLDDNLYQKPQYAEFEDSY